MYKNSKQGSRVSGFILPAMIILAATLPVSHARQVKTSQTSSVQVSSPASAAPEEVSPSPAKDPYEKFNRAMFSFNDKLDKFILKPAATLYNKIMPKPLNQGIHNFFNNIGELPTIADDVLQLHFYQMTNDLWRLGINSTVGIGGLFDVASRMGLPYYANDFGLTLAYWGYTDSNYLVLPFFGPNTVRDGIGIPVDYYGFSVYPYIDPTSLRYEIYALAVVDRRAQLLQFQSVFEEAAIDRYVFMRNAYMQRRAWQIQKNQQLGVFRTAASNAGEQKPEENYNSV